MLVLGLASIQKWIGGTLLAWKELFVGPSPANIPPSLPYRCGTMLLRLRPEEMIKLDRAWRDEEDRFIAWVTSHPAPRADWLKSVERLKRSRAR